MTKRQMQEQEEARTELRALLPPGTTVKTVLRHVSRSGMMRHISLFVARDGEIIDITWPVARALDMRRADDGGIKIGGCGMDMAFSVVHNLGYALYPDGFTCTGRDSHPNRCPSNDHLNGDRDYTPHHHEAGGYALRQEAL